MVYLDHFRDMRSIMKLKAVNSSENYLPYDYYNLLGVFSVIRVRVYLKVVSFYGAMTSCNRIVCMSSALFWVVFVVMSFHLPVAMLSQGLCRRIHSPPAACAPCDRAGRAMPGCGFDEKVPAVCLGK